MKNLKLRAWLKEDKEMISVEEMAFDTKYVRNPELLEVGQ